MEKIKFNSSFGNFPQFIGLAIIRGSGDRLIQQVMGNEKSHGICHFQNYLNGKSKVQRVSSPAESASYGKWQVPWDLPFSEILKWHVPGDLPLSKVLESG